MRLYTSVKLPGMITNYIVYSMELNRLSKLKPNSNT
jgi:hypothetical protein